MNRFHIVVSNYNKIQSFVDTISKLKMLDPTRDSIYVFDCSPDSQVKQQFDNLKKLSQAGFYLNKNAFFIKRRNWALNEGTFLDYFRCLISNKISRPQYCLFMQEHYLDTKNNVNDDTLPEDQIIDLHLVSQLFKHDRKVGCAFYSRNGIRACMSNPAIKGDSFFWGDANTLKYLYPRSANRHSCYSYLNVDAPIPGSFFRAFCVDGGNFICKPESYMKYFKQHPTSLTKGDGSYGLTHVWEVNKGKILSDQGITWVDMVNTIKFSSYEGLKLIEKEKQKPLSKHWYDNRIWYYYYGRDQIRYPPQPFFPIVRFGLLEYIKNQIRYDRNTKLTFYE